MFRGRTPLHLSPSLPPSLYAFLHRRLTEEGATLLSLPRFLAAVKKGEEEGRWERERYLPVLVATSPKGEVEEGNEEVSSTPPEEGEGSRDLRYVFRKGG